VEKLSIVIALIIFSILVIVHEFGHFIVAKMNHIVVNEFSIGMGPRLFSFKKGETRYSIKLLPFGGSCAMLGEDEDTNVEGSFNSKSVWARMAVVVAGPVFNFVLAWVLAIIVIAYSGADVSNVIQVDKDSAAYEAGLRVGDRILEYNGTEAVIGRQIYLDGHVNPLDGGELEITYERDGEKHTISYVPDSIEKYMVGMTYTASDSEAQITVTKDGAMAKVGAISGDVIVKINDTDIATGAELAQYLEEHPFDGSEVKITLNRNGKEKNIELKPKMTVYYDNGFYPNTAGVKQSIGGIIKYSFVEVKYQVSMVVKSLKMLVTGQVSTQEMSGPVGIVDVIGDTYEETKDHGFMVTLMTMINMAIMLSANLGVMNLLPIPALDGGRLLFYIIEVIRRKPLDREKEGMVHIIGFVILMALMVFLVFNDIGKML